MLQKNRTRFLRIVQQTTLNWDFDRKIFSVEKIYAKRESHSNGNFKTIFRDSYFCKKSVFR